MKEHYLHILRDTEKRARRAIRVQNLTQGPADQINVFLSLLQLPGIEVNILHPHRGCKNIHIPVVNIAPLRCDCCGSGLISQCFGRVIIIFGHHQLI